MKKLALSLLLLAVCAVPAFSEMMDMSMMEKREGHGQMMEMGKMGKMGEMCLENADKIGLTDVQLTKIKASHNDMEKKQARFKADVKIAEIELNEIMEVKDFDLEKASSQVRHIAEIKTVHHLEMVKGMKEIRTILTDEQFKKMQKMMPMKMDEKAPPRKMMKMKK